VIPPLELDVPASPEVVGDIRQAVSAFAERVGVRDVWAVGLAVSEAVTNVVVHAYRGQDPGRIALTAEHPPDDGLVVTVQDTGGGLAPRSDSPGLGLGLSLVAQLADAIELSVPPAGGTRLWMCFAVAE